MWDTSDAAGSYPGSVGTVFMGLINFRYEVCRYIRLFNALIDSNVISFTVQVAILLQDSGIPVSITDARESPHIPTLPVVRSW